jgi:hypothetical protein
MKLTRTLALGALALTLAGCGTAAAAQHPAPAVTKTAKPPAPLPACPGGAPRVQGAPGGPLVCDPDGPVTPPPSPAWTPPPVPSSPVSIACLVGYDVENYSTDTYSFNAGPVPAGQDYQRDTRCGVTVSASATGPVTVLGVNVAWFDSTGAEVGSGSIPMNQTIVPGQTMPTPMNPNSGGAPPPGAVTAQVLSYNGEPS